MSAIKENKVAFTNWIHEQDEQKKESCIVLCESVLCSGERLPDCKTLNEYLQSMIDCGVSVVYVWDLYVFGYFLADFAIKNKFRYYKELSDEEKNGKIGFPCYDYFAGANGFYNFIITMQRSKRTSFFRGGSVDAYRKIEFRGISPFLPSVDQLELYQDLGYNDIVDVEALRLSFLSINDFFTTEMNCNLLDRAIFRRVYTVGNVSQRFYLFLRYGEGATIARYQKEFPQVEEDEEDLRRMRLLLGGMVFFPPTRRKRRKLLKGENLLKFDCNSLYSFISENSKVPCGEVEEIKKSDYKKDTENYIYFLVVKDMIMDIKPHAVPCFCNPFDMAEDVHIEITQEYAVFSELFDALHNFYDIDEECLQVLGYYRIKAIKKDDALHEYNKRLKAIKEKSRAEKNKSFYLMSKICLNSLLGKFSQKQKYREYELFHDEFEDTVFLKETENVVDSWEKKHFHYIRGAYIYDMARVYMMGIMKKCNIDDIKHIYTDTDSFILRKTEFLKELINSSDFGKFKLEERLQAVGVVGKKQYFTVSENGEIKFTCSGLRRGSVLRELASEGITTADEIFREITNPKRRFSLDFFTPCKGGAMEVCEKISLSNLEKMIKTSWEE